MHEEAGMRHAASCPRCDRTNANSGLIASLKEDPHSDVLLEKVLEDARLGRMSIPMKVGDVNLADIVLSPRFAVEQGASV